LVSVSSENQSENPFLEIEEQFVNMNGIGLKERDHILRTTAMDDDDEDEDEDDENENENKNKNKK